MNEFVAWISKHPATVLLAVVAVSAVAYVAFNHNKLFYRE